MRYTTSPYRQTQTPATALVVVYNAHSRRVGMLVADGRVFNVAGHHVGTVYADGRVLTPRGGLVGWAHHTGEMASLAGQLITQMRDDGGVNDAVGRYAGHISSELPLLLRAGAAFLLLPVDRTD